jgi:hypothetical protein
MFVFHLVLLIGLMLTMSTANLIIVFNKTEEINNFKALVIVIKEYPASVVIAILSLLFGALVVSLFGFHSVIIGLNLTT